MNTNGILACNRITEQKLMKECILECLHTDEVEFNFMYCKIYYYTTSINTGLMIKIYANFLISPQKLLAANLRKQHSNKCEYTMKWPDPNEGRQLT